MNFFQFLAWLISPNIWRTLPHRSSSGRNVFWQCTQRHCRLHVTLQLLLISSLSCLLSFYILSKPSHLLMKFTDQKPNIGKQLFFKNNNIPYETRQRNASKNSLAACDIYTGTWAPEDAMPPYNSSTCPFAEVGFLCQDNGRQDADYLKWKWQPTGCDIPIFDISDIRRRLKGLRVAFVGDSMGRTQWESFICLLMADIADKSSVFEVHGNTITKKSPYLAVRFSFFNFTVEYYRSPYLVQEGAPPKHVPKRVLSTIKLDKIEQTEARWMQADVLVFNTGHWWTKSKTFARGCYFQVGKSIRLGLSLESAYRTALNTWATWVKTKVNLTKTQVFFRSYEPSHWEGDWQMQVCRSETRPLLNLSYTENFPHLQALNDVIQEVNAPITVLNITSMSAYRQDSHVANWTQGNMVDCGHWCLPGLPDWWNRLFYTALLKNGVGVWA